MEAQLVNQNNWSYKAQRFRSSTNESVQLKHLAFQIRRQAELAPDFCRFSLSVKQETDMTVSAVYSNTAPCWWHVYGAAALGLSPLRVTALMAGRQKESLPAGSDWPFSPLQLLRCCSPAALPTRLPVKTNAIVTDTLLGLLVQYPNQSSSKDGDHLVVYGTKIVFTTYTVTHND